MEGVEEVFHPKDIKSGEMVNYSTNFYKKGSDLHQMIYFDNVSEMIDCCTENNKNKTWDNKKYSLSGSGQEWTFGKDFPNVQKTYDALMSGVIPQHIIDKIDTVKVSLYDKHPELFEIEASASKVRRRRVFSEHDGELNIDKYMSGDIEMWERMTRRPTKQSIRIMINSCLHCGHDSNEFQEGMIMVTAFLDILDRAGITSEVWYAPISRGSSHDIKLAGVFCRIKSSEEVLDVCKMLSCGAPGLFRHYTFRVWCNLLKGQPSYGLGSMVTNKDELKFVKELNNFDVMINANDTPQETFNIISTTLKELF